MDLQKKWNDNCQRLHRACQILGTDNYQMPSNVVGLPYVSDKERTSNQISKNPDVTQNLSGCGNASGLQKITKVSPSISLPLVSEPKDKDFISKLQVRLSKSEQLQPKGFRSQLGALSELVIQEDSASPSSVTSVTTDLVLGTFHEPPCKEEKPASGRHMERLEDLSGCLPSKKVDEFSRNVPEVLVRSYPYSAYPDSLLKDKYPPMQTPLGSKVTSDGVFADDRRCLRSSNMCSKPDPSDYKTVYTSLIKKVGRQEGAIHAISEAMVRCTTGGHETRRRASLKGDIWLSFLGPDKVGKKRAAMALAELVSGSSEKLIHFDLGYQDGLSRPNTICDQQEISEYDVRFRGKMIVDQIAEEVGKNPCSVFFLENINKADCLVQNSLFQAIKTGKFSDSRGREFSIDNGIFVTTAKTIRGKTFTPGKECINFSEERILGAQRWQLKIILESVSEAAGSNRSFNVSITSRQEPRNRNEPPCSVSASKRKLDVSDDHKEQHEFLGTLKRAHKTTNTFLDLNLPVEEAAASDTDCSSGDENNSISDNSEAWVEEFFNLMDEIVDFRPFDFDALADYVLKEISKSLGNTIGCGCALEIDVKAMEQILAATWLLEIKGELNNWLEQVLARSLRELRQRYNLPTCTTVLRLVACEGALTACAPGISLPSRIVVE